MNFDNGLVLIQNKTGHLYRWPVLVDFGMLIIFLD